MSDAAHHPDLAHHFEDIDQQHEAASLGMWAFLITEVMFFGGLFLLYAVYRSKYPEAYLAASDLLNPWMGTFNTAILIGSSLTMVLAILAAQEGKQNAILRWIGMTALLGSAFLVVKAFEYAGKFEHHLVPGEHFAPHDLAPELWPQAEIFFSLYFAMTGLHAFHMILGLGLMAYLAWMAVRGRFKPDHHPFLEGCGLYWHFVDLVWIFLFPLLYLI